MRRNQRNIPAGKQNPVREMMLERQRAAQHASARQIAAQLKSDLPALIEDQVDERVQRLESKLLDDFKQIGERAIEQSTAVLNEQLNERIETLEQISSIQSRTITRLRDSSKIADQKVSSVVNSIERTLSEAVPGFQLEASPRALRQNEQPSSKPAKADLLEIEEPNGKYGYCPNCTSTRIRRANRKGLWEEFLRLFFLAPFRCRACRHKFYRF